MKRSSPPSQRAFIVLAALAVAACTDTVPAPTSLRSTTSAPRHAVTDVAAQQTPSQLDVARVVPGFGGYFIDASGRPTVYLTDASQRDAAAQALSGFLSSFGWTAADLQVRQAQYDYLQLNAWYTSARPAALGVTKAVYGDIDEANNRLTFAGLDAAALTNIAGILSNAGVPSGAVALKVSGPVRQLSTLRDRVRPPYGGLQLNFWPTSVSPLTLVCTLGFNVVEGADTSFITNSHCSNVQGGTTLPTDYYQATRGLIADPGNYIAREVEDPDYALGAPLGPCPIGRRCRTADVSRAKYSAGLPFVLGRIARPAAMNPTGPTLADTIGVDAVNPYFTIASEQGTSVVGQTLNKVGRTSGWTSGPVVATCVDVDITDSDISQMCQDFVDAYDAGGDSGSPMFGFNSDASVFLAGILWGSSTDLETGHVQIIMSPLQSIKNEIGDIKTFDPPVTTTKKTKRVK